MGLMPMIMSMQAINMRHRAENVMFGAFERQTALASRATGSERPAETARLARMDRALQIQGAAAQSLYFAALAMQESAQRMQQQEQKLKRRLMDAGAIFV